MTQEDPDRRSEPIKVTFSLPQLAGGALAAATAALIGSQLGVAGTIAGAAVASVVGGVAGTLYSAGLDRTHRRVTEAIRRGYASVLEEDDTDTKAIPAVAETAVLPAVDETAGIPTVAGVDVGRASRPGSAPLDDLTDATAVLPAVPSSAMPPAAVAEQHPRRRRILVAMAVSVATIFLATMIMITAVELGIGRSLDGSSGTTVGGGRRPTPAATTSHKPTPSASATPSEASSAPTTPTQEPTPSASLAPTPVVEPTPTVTEPVVTPTPAATAS